MFGGGVGGVVGGGCGGGGGCWVSVWAGPPAPRKHALSTPQVKTKCSFSIL